jgi:hypothetical protein
MTKFQKQMLTIAAAGALTAVTALPAMAFENEFHGMFGVKTYFGNYDGTGNALTAAGTTPNAFNSVTAQANPNAHAKTSNYIDQRLRIMYVAKASDDLKLVTQFEVDTVWGNNTVAAGAAGASSGTGGGIDADNINIKVKHAYLDFNLGKSLNAKIGMQAYKDQLQGLYVDADLPMAYATYKVGSYNLGLGYSRFNDDYTGVLTGTVQTDGYRGNYSANLFVLDNSFAINKDSKVGIAYYLNTDDSVANGQKRINTLGLYGNTKMGNLTLAGFAAMQAGVNKLANVRTSYHGWAADVVAKLKVGSGTAKTGFLFTSGDNTTGAGHNHGWQTLSSNRSATDSNAAQNSYNESGMMILVRNLLAGGAATYNYMRVPVTNIALAHFGYDAALTEKLNLVGNVGMAWVPASKNLNGATAATGTVQGGDYMGTEFNVEVGYKMYKNLTLKAQAALVALGAAEKAYGYANPWTTRLGAHYSF